MAKIIKRIKAWLYDNVLTTEDPNDRIARPIMDKPATNADVAAYIKDQGSEFKYETIKSIIDQCANAQSTFLLSGRPVNTPFINASLGIEGSFNGDSDQFDRKRHKLKANIKAGYYLRQQMQNISVDILGMAQVGPVISEVYDVHTATANEQLTPGRIIKITGDKIKLMGVDASVGVNFIHAESQKVAAVKTSQLATNTPKELIFIVPPELTEGSYYVEVCTQYSNGTTLLKQARTTRFSHALDVIGSH
ncbi:MAG: DUF4469 domain-containing protein [Bacteroidales bacterium]|nr:DUF4469 domain-containing protein [Bacteroidales bacterium]